MTCKVSLLAAQYMNLQQQTPFVKRTDQLHRFYVALLGLHHYHQFWNSLSKSCSIIRRMA